MSRRTGGFTLLELVIAVAVGSFGLAAAAHLVTWATRKSGQGMQSTETSARQRVIMKQIRQDLALAGYGSTGAIGVPPGPGQAGGWSAAIAGSMVANLAGGVGAAAGQKLALPAVCGVDNYGGGNPNILPESDLVQLVVPDPMTATRLLDPLIMQPAGPAYPLVTELDLVNPGPEQRLIDCLTAGSMPFLYIVDHSSPNGAGRTMMMPHGGAGGAGSASSIPAGEPIIFTTAPGTEVMCARISTYWVDNEGYLHRSDVNPAAPVILNAGQPVFLDPAANLSDDALAGGVEDLQVSYMFNAMVSGTTGGQFTVAGNEAFSATGAVNPVGTPTFWFEVRMVRFNLMMRSMRRVINTSGATMDQLLLENRATVLQVEPAFAPKVGRGAAELTNLRLFDENADESIGIDDVEPY